MGSIFCLDSLLLPSALKRQWILAWLIMSLLGILASVAWLYRKQELQAILEPSSASREVLPDNPELLQDDEPVVSQHNLHVEELREADLIESVEELREADLIESVEKAEVEVNQAEERLRGLEELLDLGFAAKQAGRYALAAQWFEEALKRNSEPNLAGSLLVDIYWLWEDVHGEELARVQLKILWDELQDRLGEADEFLVWLNKVGLSARDFTKLGG